MIDWIPLPFSFGAKRRRRADAASVTARSLASRAIAVPSLRESEAAFNRELQRARRYERPLSVVVLSTAEAPRRPARSEPGMEEEAVLLETRIPYLATLLAGSILRRATRESDVIAYAADDDRFVLLLPETRRTDARRAVARLDTLLHDRMRRGVRAGIAEFPVDGFTRVQLVEKASDAWRQNPVGSAGLSAAGIAERNGNEP